MAIILVGSYLANAPDVTLEKVKKRLEKKGLAAKPLNPADASVADYGVRAAIDLTWDVLSSETQKFAVFLSMFACAPMEWRLVETALHNIDPDDAEDWRDELLKYSLLKKTSKETVNVDGYKFHPLVWEYLREKISTTLDDQIRRHFVKAIVQEAETIEYNAPLADYEKVRPSIPHITEVAEHWTADLPDENVITPCTRLAWFNNGFVDYEREEFWALISVDLARKRLPENHVVIATSFNNLAKLYKDQGKYAAAEPLYREALTIAQKSLQKNHPTVATYFNNLASLYHNQGKYEVAEPLYRKALAIDRESLPRNHPDLARDLNNLANLYRRQRKYEAAETLFQEALTIAQESRSVNHPHIASSLNNLALLCIDQEKYEDAESLFREVLIIAQESLPKNHCLIATYSNNLAELYRKQGKYEVAKPAYQKALAICKETLGKDHPTTHTIRGNYENFLHQQNEI